jgi:uroporphyrinogen decarboxylase
MKTDFIRNLSGQTTNQAPVWLMRQAGRYLPEYREVRAKMGGFLNLCYTPEFASEVTLQPIRRFDLDAAIIFSDILVVPHALGQHVWFEEGEGPRLDSIQSIDDLGEFNQDQFLKHLDPVFEALSLTRSALQDDKSLIGFAGAPWTLACYMINGRGSRDYQNVRLFSLQNPDIFQAIIDRLIEAVSSYLIEKVKHGANALQIFDSWCGVLNVEEFNRWSIQPTKKIVARVKASYPDIPIIGFPRMAGYGYEKYVAETGINAVSCDPNMPLDTIKDLQQNICVQGNLDPLLLLQGGDAMVDQVNKICTALRGGPFVFNLGHGVIKDTPPDHVELLVKTVKDFK